MPSLVEIGIREEDFVNSLRLTNGPQRTVNDGKIAHSTLCTNLASFRYLWFVLSQTMPMICHNY